MLARLWRLKWAALVFMVAGVTILVLPAPLWVRVLGFAAATFVYWRYGWKYLGIGQETREAVRRALEEQERERD